MSSVQNDLILGEGRNSVVCHVVLKDKDIGEARHVPEHQSSRERNAFLQPARRGNKTAKQ